MTATPTIRHLSTFGTIMKKTLTNIARATQTAYLKAAVAAVTFAGAVAPAGATSLGTAITNVKTDASAAVGAAIAVFAVIGVGAIGYGGLQMKKKGGDRGDDVTWGQVVYPMIGGTICLCIALISGIWATEFGGSQSSDGQGITVSP
jgi:hypothetical protein